MALQVIALLPDYGKEAVVEAEYMSHYRPEGSVYQTNREHTQHVATLAENYCRIPLLKKAAWLLGAHHDAGKNTDRWQAYFQASVRQEGKHFGVREDHSTLGGLVVEQYEPRSRFSEMLQAVIYMHHGLSDCVSTSDGSILLQMRAGKYEKGTVRAVGELISDWFPQVDMAGLCREAKRDMNALTRQMMDFARDKDGKYKFGQPDFYIGLCVRMLLSCLVDADWRDTADFMAGRESAAGMCEDAAEKVWEQGIYNLEKRLTRFKKGEEIDRQRMLISDQCREAAMSAEGLLRLNVPTGAGKTLSSLRFALYHAKTWHKRHIFYIAPFKSILEQNAQDIRDTLGMPDMVLEHHSDVIPEDEAQLWRYERLTENWDESPVIVTTAVQFLDTLFQGSRSKIRRFHSLCDSVIVFDEVQALPVKIIQMFNMAVNFLTKICNTTVVLCTATQPLFSAIRENRMLPYKAMTEDAASFETVFRRVSYHNCMPADGSGISGEQAAEFVREKAEQYGQVLLIVNTKACARHVYEQLQGKFPGALYHLSTGMCAQHRSDALKEIRAKLKGIEPVICISTQLVEAGVDFSFRCVIRSLAGLDNLIQAAGRCNRNGKEAKGHVFLIRMSKEEEHITSLPDIKKAQDAMEQFLGLYKKEPERFGYRMDSQEAIRMYYTCYFYNRQVEMGYAVCMDGVHTSLVDLLSANRDFAGGCRDVKLKQAFRSAGEAFCVIEEKGGMDVVTPYGQALQMVDELEKETDFREKRLLLRKLQRYTIHLSEGMVRKLADGIYHVGEEQAAVLEARYYDQKTGVLEEAAPMQCLML